MLNCLLRFFFQENPERYKRPFSADAKERQPTRNFLKQFSAELLKSYNGKNNFIILPDSFLVM